MAIRATPLLTAATALAAATLSAVPAQADLQLVQSHELRDRGGDRHGRARAPRQRAAGSASIPANAARCCRATCQAKPCTSMPARCRSMAARRCRSAAMPTSVSLAATSCWPRRAQCNRPGQELVRFTAVKPNETEKGLTAYLAEDAEYTDEQARDAAIQRLLVIAGYDANPIDGIRGSKTDAALAQFIADNRLENTAAGRSDFFDVLMAAAQKPDGSELCLVQRDHPCGDGGARHRGQGQRDHPRLVSGLPRQVPAARPAPPNRTAFTASARRSLPTAGCSKARSGPGPGAARRSCARATSSSN